MMETWETEMVKPTAECEPMPPVAQILGDAREMLMEMFKCMQSIRVGIKSENNGMPIDPNNVTCLMDDAMEIRRLADMNLQAAKHIKEMLGV